MQARFKGIPEALIPLYINERVNYFARVTKLSELEEDCILHNFPRAPLHSFQDHKLKIRCLVCALNSSLNWKSSEHFITNTDLYTKIVGMIEHHGVIPYSPSFENVNIFKLFIIFKQTFI